MTAAKAGILRTGELKSAIGAPIGTREGSTSMIKGITVFGFGAPIGLHKRNCDDNVMVADAKRSQTSGPSSLFQTMRRPHRFIKPLTMRLMRVLIADQTPDNPRL
ncbi:hypothetical protein GGE07_005432 [Sinorhizobium terangae]|uniref:Uncharacterized protein n=1 Tax=Sinorhizobium terangae TaxID=110322 RepID=A0A6N7LNZ5_SINTE|nr:hypothetical protein [Sinorhizobium terangae]MBB4188753.1 hypothetical protein [Sinorhizobium terangae]MQX18899.1 hypothetical protein [Sinorhizobium terangae]